VVVVVGGSVVEVVEGTVVVMAGAVVDGDVVEVVLGIIVDDEQAASAIRRRG
jgi:hypothetical protein